MNEKKKKFYAVLSLLLMASGFSLLIIGVLSMKNSKDKEPEYLPCPVLEEGETMDVIVPASLYDGKSAHYTARYVKREGRCVDAWVNENGELVERFDRETLEKEYKRMYDMLMKSINDSKDAEIKKEVSYDYSELYMYVSDDTDIMDFGSSGMIAPRACLKLRLLQGLSIEDATVTVIYIYEPNGKEILRVDEKTNDFHMNQEQWEKLLEEARQG